MRAVNLIPTDLRGAQGGAPARTGAAVYFLIGGLALAVVLVAALALAGRAITQQENDLSRVTAEADVLEARAGQLEPYTKFATLRQNRVTTVTSLARNRFNWPYALREVSRTLPADVELTQLLGTVAPGVAVEGVSSGETATLRSSLPTPAIEITGCSADQADTARYLASLRLIEGVTRVSLATSTKALPSGDTAASASSCETLERPKFEAIVFFETSSVTTSGPSAGGSAPAAAPAPAASTGTNG